MVDISTRSARAQISRTDFGIDLDMPLEGGGAVVGDGVTIHVEIEATPQAARA